MRRLLPVTLIAAAVACTTQTVPPPAASTASAAPTTEFLASPDSTSYPFSPGVRVGNMIYLSGQLGATIQKGTMVLVPGGIEAETRQAMENVKQILERNHSSLEHVVKCTVMIADMADWPKLNPIYASYFPGPKPARSAIGANGLALNAKVEIECWATVNPGA